MSWLMPRLYRDQLAPAELHAAGGHEVRLLQLVDAGELELGDPYMRGSTRSV